MFCPRCGQQMASDARFCSRCGFVLGSVSQLLVTNGIPGQIETQIPAPLPPTQRDKGIKLGAKILFFAAVLIPLAIILSIAIDEPGPLAIPFLGVVVGAALMLYARLFWAHHTFPRQGYQIGVPSPFIQNPQNPMLPPPSAVPVNNYRAPRLNTADMQERPSVVEHTTKLLEQEPE